MSFRSCCVPSLYHGLAKQVNLQSKYSNYILFLKSSDMLWKWNFPIYCKFLANLLVPLSPRQKKTNVILGETSLLSFRWDIIYKKSIDEINLCNLCFFLYFLKYILYLFAINIDNCTNNFQPNICLPLLLCQKSLHYPCLTTKKTLNVTHSNS